MIITLVRFSLPVGIDLEAATDLFVLSASRYRGVPGLLKKHYLFADGIGGGIYLWESREAAERHHTSEWRKIVADRYGCEPEIQWFESPVTVDNAGQDAGCPTIVVAPPPVVGPGSPMLHEV